MESDDSLAWATIMLCMSWKALSRRYFSPCGQLPTIKLPSAVAGISLKVNQCLTSVNSAKQNLAYSTKASMVVRVRKPSPPSW